MKTFLTFLITLIGLSAFSQGVKVNQFTTNHVGAAVRGQVRFSPSGGATNSLIVTTTYSSIRAPNGAANATFDGNTIILDGILIGNGSGLTNFAASNIISGGTIPEVALGTLHTNWAFTSTTNYGSIGWTNLTFTDSSGWQNTNSGAASQGVRISKGNITLDGTLTGNLASGTNLPVTGLALGATNQVIANTGAANVWTGNPTLTNVTVSSLALWSGTNRITESGWQLSQVTGTNGNIVTPGAINATRMNPGFNGVGAGSVALSVYDVTTAKLQVVASGNVLWTPSGTGSQDVGINRNAAGVMEINNGNTAGPTGSLLCSNVNLKSTLTATNGVILPNISSVATAAFTNSVPQSSTTVTNFLLVNLNGNFVTVHTNAAAANSLIYRKISFTESASWP